MIVVVPGAPPGYVRETTAPIDARPGSPPFSHPGGVLARREAAQKVCAGGGEGHRAVAGSGGAAPVGDGYGCVGDGYGATSKVASRWRAILHKDDEQLLVAGWDKRIVDALRTRREHLFQHVEGPVGRGRLGCCVLLSYAAPSFSTVPLTLMITVYVTQFYEVRHHCCLSCHCWPAWVFRFVNACGREWAARWHCWGCSRRWPVHWT
eukprot:COSAG01_NODE_362_length_18130_cov_34.672307_1_plen_207_part_00